MDKQKSTYETNRKTVSSEAKQEARQYEVVCLILKPIQFEISYANMRDKKSLKIEILRYYGAKFERIIIYYEIRHGDK